MKKHMTPLQKLSPADLAKKHAELTNELVNLRKSVKLGDTQNYHIATTTRRELARVNMLISQVPTATVEAPVEAKTKKAVKTATKEKK